MADRVRLEIDINDQSEGAAPTEAETRRAAAEMLDAATRHRDAARRWQEQQQDDLRRMAGPSREERRARERDPLAPENLPTPENKRREKERNPFDLGKPGMDGLDRLLYQNGLGALGNLVAMLNKRAEALRKGESTLMPNLGVASAVGGVVGGAADTAAGAVRSGAGAMAGLSGNDYRATMNQVAEGVIDTARKIPVVGEALAGTLNLITAPARALVDVFKGMADRGKELADYDPRIAMAQAMAEIETTFADIREAQAMGEEYAQVIKLENEFKIMWREAILPIKKMLVEWAVENGEAIKATLVSVAEVLKVILTVLQAIGKAIAFSYDWTVGWFTGPLKDVLAAIAQNTRPAGNEVNPTEQLFDVLLSGRPAEVIQRGLMREVGEAVPMDQRVVEPNFGG